MNVRAARSINITFIVIAKSPTYIWSSKRVRVRFRETNEYCQPARGPRGWVPELGTSQYTVVVFQWPHLGPDGGGSCNFPPDLNAPRSGSYPLSYGYGITMSITE